MRAFEIVCVFIAIFGVTVAIADERPIKGFFASKRQNNTQTFNDLCTISFMKYDSTNISKRYNLDYEASLNTGQPVYVQTSETECEFVSGKTKYEEDHKLVGFEYCETKGYFGCKKGGQCILTKINDARIISRAESHSYVIEVQRNRTKIQFDHLKKILKAETKFEADELSDSTQKELIYDFVENPIQKLDVDRCSFSPERIKKYISDTPLEGRVDWSRFEDKHLFYENGIIIAKKQRVFDNTKRSLGLQ